MKQTHTIKNWLNLLEGEGAFLIAGPCSAETEEQVMESARLIAKHSDAKAMRAGIWKPRTRPGSFEGVGEKALPWLVKAKKKTGLKMAIEVASPRHVELALQYDIDILWIGARTSVSPFNVQAIAESLRGVEHPVLIKNPINPDLALWIGAIERFEQQNIPNLGAVHRGFSTYEKSKYRNIPEWQIPLDLKSERPDLPLLLDPSHIAGKRDLIESLCQTALDLNYDGLMIETHPDPEHAWSDAQQQITPRALGEIFERLTVKTTKPNSPKFHRNIEELRTKIDKTDDEILQNLGDRMQIAEEIGKIKRREQVSIFQPKRWRNILEKMLKNGNGFGLSEEFVERFYKAIHQESIRHQRKED